MKNNFRLIKRADIDLNKWDRCIAEAPNGLIYAYSTYLDHMTLHWDGLVWGDYEMVMPLTWNRKWGISYLYQPPFTASLGIFGKELQPELIQQFIEHIPERFRLIDIDLNHANTDLPPGEGFRLRANYILSLRDSYEILRSSYRENVRRNCKKAEQSGCVFRDTIPVEDVMELAAQYSPAGKQLHPKSRSAFLHLAAHLQSKGMAEANGIYDSQNNLLASALYFFSHHRAYYILVGNHPNGKTIGASHWLIDRFIAKYAGQDLSLDFEGSDVRNLAFFYSGFGAKEEPYSALYLNKLPWWLAWMKK